MLEHAWFSLIFYTIIGAVALELILGDPKRIPHPVIMMGKVIQRLERSLNSGRRRCLKGCALALIVPLGAAVVAIIVLLAAYWVHPLLFLFCHMYFVWTTIAIRGLQTAALHVYAPLREGDLLTARERLSWIVGRDTDGLNEGEIARGTVETVAENTSDGITAPLFWAAVGGAPLAFAYRAVNTLDSMVGYPNERYQAFGWASARLDDAVNWLPARLTAFTMWISSWVIPGSRRILALRITLRDAPKHPSPNGGWGEAMVAGLLGVQLGGVNMYEGEVSHRALLGEASRPLAAADIRRTVWYMHGGWVVFTAVVLVIFIWLS
ncbi:adenosylcobinamide-phosphate synthase [Salsuginibacillus halophilus]|uniref:Cobalamin biosynthesis protein CobD n=1 Tax=Salsuginibacillus halophilus TaxID=517424 RepID=A0A2P8HL16_9BACI|nr:adenosylcobinamide-phosphate synthase CbiB [Salsuginibacillus halophilus]PSL46917.1 adenosylcobinamide-phosphate synthase [Salsuginibacillus halophilus]